MNDKHPKKSVLWTIFLVGWISLSVVSAVGAIKLGDPAYMCGAGITLIAGSVFLSKF